MSPAAAAITAIFALAWTEGAIRGDVLVALIADHSVGCRLMVGGRNATAAVQIEARESAAARTRWTRDTGMAILLWLGPKPRSINPSTRFVRRQWYLQGFHVIRSQLQQIP